MPRQLFLFDPPERFVAGTVGQPGDRTFYLQASGGGRTVSVALEKVQVQVLADRLGQLLEEVRRRGVGEVPTVVPHELEDTAPLDAPVEEEFRVSTMGLAWDGEDDRVVVEALAPRRRRGGRGRAAVRRRGRARRAARAHHRDGRPGLHQAGRSGWSPPAARRARCARCRSTPRGTSAPARTATGGEPAARRRRRSS